MTKKAETTSKAKPARGVLLRKDGREVKRTTVYLPPAMAKRLAIYCIEHDKDMSDVMAAALEKYL